VAALVVSLIPAQASAVSLTEGEYLAKLKDVSNLFSDKEPGDGDLEPECLGESVDPGDEQRNIFLVTSIFNEGGTSVFDLSSPTELTGMLYDLEVLAVTLVGTNLTIDFGDPVARNPLPGDVDGDIAGLPGGFSFGGVLEVYEDATKDYTTDPGGVGRYDAKLPAAPPVCQDAGSGPSFWQEGQGLAIRDQFPNVSDGALWLSAALLDLNYMVSIGQVVSPAIPFAAGTLLRENIDLSTGAGSGFAYANVFGGSFAPMIVRGLGGGLADLSLLFDLNTPILDFGPDGIPGTADDLLKDTLVYQGLGQWQLDSEDPVVFATIPEPASMSLLGLGLIGLIGAGWKKRR
jgi:hypothetical protein